MELTIEQKKLILDFQQQEITGSHVYKIFSRQQKDPHNKKVLNKIASDEYKHYEIYRKFTGVELRPGKWDLFRFSIISRILGPTFAVKLLERGEIADQELYSKLSHIPEIHSIIKDEEQHEQALIDMLTEDKLNYMGSVVLGLNDALVELTGALAGLTFALQDPSLIALTGSITGIAAAFSMAASEYLSTKSEDTGRHAVKASIYTGIAYIFTVLVLILPYLIISNVYLSLVLTLSGAVLIIAGFNYYYSIVRNEKFSRRFTEMVGLSMGVALLSFGVGLLLRKFFGIEA